MTYVKVGEVLYPAVVNGSLRDPEWDERASKSITLEMTHADACNLFVNGLKWSIVQENVRQIIQFDEEGKIKVDDAGNHVVVEETTAEEVDNSEYNLAGDITDHRDGTITVKMGKLTELEEAYEIMLGGI